MKTFLALVLVLIIAAGFAAGIYYLTTLDYSGITDTINNGIDKISGYIDDIGEGLDYIINIAE